jgi:hypothetical protein
MLRVEEIIKIIANFISDIIMNGRCVHPELKKFNLIISGRDWCNLFDEISQEQINQMQEKAMQASNNCLMG